MKRPQSYRRRYAIIGLIAGMLLAALWLTPEIAADRRGTRIVGPGEFMVVTSLPMSLLTTYGFLVPVSAALRPNDAEIPRGVAYLWLGLTPPLNWALVGLLIGAARDWRYRRRLARMELAGPHGGSG